MTAALDGAVELLDRALGYTRVVLADVTDHQLDLPTPCADWPLDDLLAHMEDALDAFTEAASGLVQVDRAGHTHGRVGVLQEKACALLGAWSRAAADGDAGAPDVTVGDVALAGPLLVATAALEITVHGWDIGQTTGRRAPIPDDLARMLLVVARQVVDPSDRGVRFDTPRPVSVDATYDAQLLAFLGRHLTGPPVRVPGNRDTGPGVAS